MEARSYLKNPLSPQSLIPSPSPEWRRESSSLPSPLVERGGGEDRGEGVFLRPLLVEAMK